jgi:multicomponent Na+:H+ antiporter subunit D
VWVLWTSSFLNACYFLPILWRVWVGRPAGEWPEEHIAARGWRETTLLLLVPPLLTVLATVVFGILPDGVASPLAWARVIVGLEYGH